MRSDKPIIVAEGFREKIFVCSLEMLKQCLLLGPHESTRICARICATCRPSSFSSSEIVSQSGESRLKSRPRGESDMCSVKNQGA